MLMRIKYDPAQGGLLLRRFKTDFGDIEPVVAEIVEKVRQEGDAALFRYTREFDGFAADAGCVRVTREEIAAAYEKVDGDLLGVFRRSAQRIREFHQRQKQNSWFQSDRPGEMLGQMLLSQHNLWFYQDLMKGIREAIANKSFAKFKNDFIMQYNKGV